MVGFSLLSMGLFFAGFSRLSLNYVMNEKKEALISTASVISETASAKTAESELNDWDLRLIISTVDKASGFHISISDREGVVQACSDEDILCGHIGRVMPADVLDKLARSKTYTGLTNLSGYYDTGRYTAAVPIYGAYSEEVVGYVFAAIKTTDITNVWKPTRTLSLMTACAVVLVALLASVIITSRQVAPLTDMAEASRKLAAGDFGVRVHTDRKDEIGELADAFNIMAAAIEKSEMSRREFVANISHELKTPMTTIAGFADGLLDGTIPRDQADRYLSIISDETRRLSRLVKRMLDISRMQSVDRASIMKSSFDVAEVARCALLALEDKINGKGLDIDVQLPEEPMMVHGEEDAITQVIYNIIDNAVKFADAGSSVTLRVWKQGEKAFVSVGDVGETIPSEDMPFIFERFHKSDHSRSLDRDGVGLGLYIVKAILSGYGEEISVTSENSYTEFTFTLSLVKTQ